MSGAQKRACSAGLLLPCRVPAVESFARFRFATSQSCGQREQVIAKLHENGVLGKTLHLGTTGPGPERLSEYAHWRVQGDIYSESPSARPPPDRVSSDHKFKPRKLGAHESSPALGYYDRSLYRR